LFAEGCDYAPFQIVWDGLVEGESQAAFSEPVRGDLVIEAGERGDRIDADVVVEAAM
jgi:hypothetical protein